MLFHLVEMDSYPQPRTEMVLCTGQPSQMDGGPDFEAASAVECPSLGVSQIYSSRSAVTESRRQGIYHKPMKSNSTESKYLCKGGTMLLIVTEHSKLGSLGP